MKKKILKNLILVVVMVVLCFAVDVTSSAETSGDYEYAVIGDGCVKITGYTGAETKLLIPSEIDGMSVIEIGNSAFYENTSIESVVIPDSVTEIGKYSFTGCKNLTELKIGNNVTYIGARAFERTGIKSLTIPDSVERMGGYAFSECSSLAELSIGKNVKRIGSYAFAGCTSLTEIVIPDSTKEIGRCAFYCCSNLENLTLSNSVEKICESAFYNCRRLISVVFSENLKSIGRQAFNGCRSLGDITIPDSVESIGEVAFSDTLFYNNKDNWENGVLYIGNHLIDVQSDFSGELTIKDSTLTIAESAFSDISELKSVTIPETVTEIPDRAFFGCESLESIVIPDTVTNIGAATFEETAYYNNTSNWENGVLYIDNHLIEADNDMDGDYIIKDGTKNIAALAFYGCDDITSLTIPASIENIGYLSVVCENIKNYYVDKNNSYYSSEDGILFNKDKTRLVKYPLGKEDTIYVTPEGVKEIGDGAFGWSDNLESVVISEGVEYVGDFVCYGIDSIYLPASITGTGLFDVEFNKRIFYGGTAEKFDNILYLMLTEHEFEDISDYDEIDGDFECDFTFEFFVNELGVYCESEYYPPIEAITCQDKGSTYGIYVPYLNSWYIEPETTTGSHIDNDGDRLCDLCGKVAVEILTSGYCGEDSTYTLYADGVLEIEGTGVISENLSDLLGYEYAVKVTSAIIHDGITGIGDYAFAELQPLKSVEIPDSVTNIGEGAFYLCYCLSSVTIPQSVETVGQLAFGICISLGDVYFYPTEAEIGLGAFGVTDCAIDETKISIEEFWETYSLAMDYYLKGEDERSYELIEMLEECIIWFENGAILERTVIYCYIDSTAEAYAIEYGVKYINFPPHEHTYTETVIVEPTCAQTGVMSYKCDCGYEYTDDIATTENHYDSDYDGYCDVCYRLVADIENCDCTCHDKGLWGFIYRIFKAIKIFLNVDLLSKILHIDWLCDCGIAHY